MQVFATFMAAASVSLAVCFPAAGQEAGPVELKPILQIEWREGPEYPTGIQESACGVIGGQFISAGGFTRHARDIVKTYPQAFGGAANGFTNIAFAFDPVHEAEGWTRIPDYPGSPRQGAMTAVVDGVLYAVGGFSYAEPLTHTDGYRLNRRDGEWVWSRLPCDLPWPSCEGMLVALGKRLYLVSGADYFPAPGVEDADFHAETGRTGAPVGQALLMLDTGDLAAGWKRLADCPGTPRLGACVAGAGGKLYVLGGVFSPLKKPENATYSDGTASYAYYNCVDSWAYDPATDTWLQLADMPDGANRRGVTYADRYVLLIGGYKYPQTWRLDGARTWAQTPEERVRDWKTFFQNTVLAYDTQTATLGTADPLLDRTSWPGAALDGDTVYSLGGEGGARMWHPATFQIGKITPVQ